MGTGEWDCKLGLLETSMIEVGERASVDTVI